MLKELLNQDNILKYYEKILYEAYDIDEDFPFSCDYIAQKMTTFLNDSYLSGLYIFSYVRGHYHNEEVNQYCCILNKIDYSVCKNCSCDVYRQHSFIKAVDKTNGEITIIDFTAYQFNDDFYSWLIDSHAFKKEQVINHIMNYGFVVTEDEKRMYVENM